MSEAKHNSNILFRDLYGITLVLFIGMVVILAQLAKAETESTEVKMPGSLMANIYWPDGDIDVDLWVDGPGEPLPVGYSNKGGLLWNLLRDDLGKYPDFLPQNYENAYTRGLPAGKYRINVQCYRCPKLPVEVRLEVAKRLESSTEVVATSTITINRNYEEKTGVAFELDNDHMLVKDSLNTVFAPLRSGSKQ